MGLDVQALRLLLVARRMGAKFDRTITLGRQICSSPRFKFAMYAQPLVYRLTNERQCKSRSAKTGFASQCLRS